MASSNEVFAIAPYVTACPSPTCPDLSPQMLEANPFPPSNQVPILQLHRARVHRIEIDGL